MCYARLWTAFVVRVIYQTNFAHPFTLIFSVRLNERKVKDEEENKKMAYLIDLKTICVCKYFLLVTFLVKFLFDCLNQNFLFYFV